MGFARTIFSTALCATTLVACRTVPSEVASANRRYAKADYDRALASYERALPRVSPTHPNAARLHYNIGTTHYQLNQTGTAAAELLQAAERAPLLRGKQRDAFRVQVYFNMGNAFYREGDFARAVDAYVEALKLEPADMDAKHNLELALDRLRQQASDGGAPDSDTPNPTPQPGDGDESPLPQRPAGMSPEEARRLLDMLGNDDAQRQQQRLRNLVPPRYEVEKDW